MIKSVTISMLGLALAVAAGCDKKVTLVVTNTLPEPATNVSVSVPGEGTMMIGTLMTNDQATRKVSIPKDMLPATCTARANSAVSEFNITDKTPGKLYLYIDRSGIVTVRPKDQVETQRHFEGKREGPSHTVVTPDEPAPSESGSGAPRIIHQDTVVE